MVSIDITSSISGGLEFVKNNEPDLIIISDSLPGSIPDFCERLRVLTYNSRPIIIVMSKSSDINDKVELLERGADDFISEPVNIEEFKMRIKAHLRRDIELNLDSKTLLPDKKYTYRALKRAIYTQRQQAVLLISIENFLPYKTIYSELAADKLIQSFITIIKSALGKQDYLGQISETEFLIITHPIALEKLAEFLTFAFDTVTPKFYSEKDVKRGCSLIKGENLIERRVEFVYILAGGMELNEKITPDIVIEQLKQIKSNAKLPVGSNYAIKRLQLTGEGSIVTKKYNKTIFIFEEDESLKLLLRTTLELQGYDVIENNLQEIPAVAIIDAGNNLENLPLVTKIKSKQEFINTRVIITSAKHNKSAILNTKADLYLPKPFEIADLLNWANVFIQEVNN